jgi:class 3 adenylate cyclase
MSEDDWVEAVEARLNTGAPALRRLTRPRRARMLTGLSQLTRAGRDATFEADKDIAELLEAIGLHVNVPRGSARDFAAVLDRGEAIGLDRDALPHVIQAYVRAVSRIVAAEAAVGADALRAAPPEHRTAIVTELVDTLLPASVRGFDLLHRALLRDALLEVAAGGFDDAAGGEALAVGMVDIVRSTDYFSRASSEELEQVVDALFAAGQTATAERAAHVVKYVGDGVFLAAADAASVADAALDLVRRLEASLPLRARGGVSHGPVVQRAGDLFGMPVNVAQLLTKAAKPGTVLLSAAAAGQLPRARYGRLRDKELPHPALGTQRVATLRPAPADT